ncbi:MAG: HAD family hydrolase [Elusimicrobia bacterium]|nr:HAD family hydrolase [Elusimicrobiota bacterium]
MKLLLFDVDGTLVSTGGAGVRALNRTFEQLYEIPEAMSAIDPAGKTDPAIVREIFHERLERDCSEDELQTVCQAYLRVLPEEVSQSTQYRVMPGVTEFLRVARSRQHVMIGLGTGNLEVGARIKLERADLNDFFPFGGFGSDSEDRSEVLRIAAWRAQDRGGCGLNREAVFVIGDTERDIEAGRKAGMTTVAVATGHADVKRLRRAEPDFVLSDFRDAAPLLEAIEAA